MRVIVMTKPFEGVGLVELADRLAEVGADGADLVVRDGQAVTPADPGGIVKAGRALERAGLGLEVVTTDLVEADGPAERIFAACAEAAVRVVRTGFFRYDPEQGYARCLEVARRGLAGLAKIAAEHGVRLAVQVHHRTIHPSAAHLLRLIGDLDDVLVYADPGNQAKEGSEDWRLSFDLIGERVACVGVKNAAWHHGPEGWACYWVPLAGGVVAWPKIITGLRERGYPGPLSLHLFYPTDDLPTALHTDLTHLRAWT